MSTCWLHYMEAVKVLLCDLVQRLSSWIQRVGEARSEAHTMSRDYWMPDESCRVCYDCEAPFNLFNRRHHCRICGRIFCWKCTQHTLPLVPDGNGAWQGVERVRTCNFCFKLKQEEQRQVGDSKIVEKPSTPTLSPSSCSFSSSSTGTAANQRTTTTSSSSSSASASENPRQMPLSYGFRSSNLDKIESIAERQPRRKHGRRSQRTDSPRRRDLSPNPYDFCSNRSEGDDDEDEDARNDMKEGIYGQPRIFDLQSQDDEEEGDSCVETESSEVAARDDARYSSQAASGNNHGDAILIPENNLDIERSLSRRSLVSSDDYEESVDESNLYTQSVIPGPTYAVEEELLDVENDPLVWVPPPPEDEGDELALTLVEEDDEEENRTGWGGFSNNAYRFHDKATASYDQKKAMRAVVDGHFRALVGQLLDGEGLDISESDADNWLKIVADLSQQAANYIKPDTSKGGMDPAGYVKVKCIASGRRSDSCVVKGVVCKRNVAHRRMASRYKNVKLLLLGGSLEYHRVPNQLSSLDALLQQEKEHLSMTVSRIEAHHPNLVLVEKTISRQAQERLLAKDISFALNIKRPLLERIARCTGAEIVPSPDHLLKAKSGHCDLFHVEKYEEELESVGESGKKSTRTLMFFEGCPNPLGCTVLLMGANVDELLKVKRVVQFAVFAAYQLALETSFLVDEGATVPITVAVPDKPQKCDRSITTVPGFVSTPNHPQTAPHVALNHNNVNPISDFPTPSSNFVSWSDTHVRYSSAAFSATWSVTSSSMSSRNNSPTVSPQNIYREFDPKKPGFEDSDAELSTTRNPVQEPIYNRHVGFQYAGHEHMVKSSRTASSSIHVFMEVERTKEAQNILKEDTMVETTELVTSGESQSVSVVEGAEVNNEDFPPSPSDHHSILVSFFSSCLEKKNVCWKGQLYRIKYYGSFDKPLGKFLQDDVFDTKKKCASCELNRDAHIHSYMHRQGSLVISVRHRKEALTGEKDGKIWMWHRCLKCRGVNNVPPATHRVLMSDAAWGLSFGKFLELSFSNHAAASRVAACGHSLHRDCLRFYGFGSMVACFRYAPINVHIVCLPSPKLDFNIPGLNDWLSAEVQEIRDIGKLVFAKAFNTLREIEEKISIFGIGRALEARRCIAVYETSLKNYQGAFLEAVEKAVSVQSQYGCSFDILELNATRKSLAALYLIWWDRFLQLLSPRLQRGVLPARSVTLADTSMLFSGNVAEHASLAQAAGVITEQPNEQITEKADAQVAGQTNQLIDNSCGDCDSNVTDSFQDSGATISLKRFAEQTNSMQTLSEIGKSEDKSSSHGIIEEDDTNPSERKSVFYITELDDSSSVRRTLSEGHFPILPHPSYTSWTAKERNIEAHAVRVSSTGQEIPSQCPEITPDAILEETTNVCTVISDTATSGPASPVKDVSKLDDSGIQGEAPFSILYKLYSKGSQYSSNAAPESHLFLQNSYTIKLQGRLFLPLGIQDIVIPVYDEEPTSMIAYAITSQQYQAYLLDQQSDTERENERKREWNYLEFLSTDSILSHPLRSMDSFSEATEFILKDSSNYADDIGSKDGGNLQYSKSMHVKVSFSDDDAQGKVKYAVTCYYARQFDALRKTCCDSQMDFIRSLCRCRKWSAQGGKSNVFFAKTNDDRFVIKQVTKTELESFIKFGPEYFKYLSESLKSGSPTCLAKILGIFQVTIKHEKGGKVVRMVLMIMENLLYGRQVSRLYDLKGSRRSRYNADTSGKNKVLLDENLIESMLTNPIFIGNKAKRKLERAVWNDTSFLASVNVMDYSLLVGIDEGKKELVVGIIDFMRQYTWDKHFETWVKASGFLGGPKKVSPTVISPKQYKKRFRNAMKDYFLMVPDQWSPTAFAPSHSSIQSSQFENDNVNMYLFSHTKPTKAGLVGAWGDLRTPEKW